MRQLLSAINSVYPMVTATESRKEGARVHRMESARVDPMESRWLRRLNFGSEARWISQWGNSRVP